MHRYAPNYQTVCPQYQAPENIEKRHTQGIRPYRTQGIRLYALCVCVVPRSLPESLGQRVTVIPGIESAIQSIGRAAGSARTRQSPEHLKACQAFVYKVVKVDV